MFIQISNSIDSLKGETGEMPYIIHVPVFEDREKKVCRFRSKLDVDETIQSMSNEDYLKLWGVRYNLEGKIRVFDVKKNLLIDSHYLTQEEYWEETENMWTKER